MVGFNKNDTMTQNQKLIAGCLSGMMTRFITQPLDIVKIRTQLAKTKLVKDKTKFNLIRTTRKILKEEGFLSFWTGHTLGQIHSIISVSSQFYTYEQATRLIATSNIDKKYRPYLNFICGMIAGCVSATLVLPIEVIRTRQMLVQEQYKGLYNGARMVYKGGGILAFYEGLNASLCQMGPQVGIAFGVFRFLQPRLINFYNNFIHNGGANKDSDSHNKNNHHVTPEAVFFGSAIAGTAAGFFSKTMTYPFDLAKRRMQIQSHQPDERFSTPSTAKEVIRCKRLSQCLTVTYKKEGFVGLFRGWQVTVYKAQLNSIIAFTSYELCCHFIREFD